MEGGCGVSGREGVGRAGILNRIEKILDRI